jgi:DNA-binding transcriptional ArsR family regulator
MDDTLGFVESLNGCSLSFLYHGSSNGERIIIITGFIYEIPKITLDGWINSTHPINFRLSVIFKFTIPKGDVVAFTTEEPENLSLLLHPLRRRIYSILAENPGSYFFDLAKYLELPQGTLNWHLKRLESDNLIKSLKFAGKRIYYPAGLRSAEAERIFTVLRPPTAKKIFTYVLNAPGAFQSQIAAGITPPVHHDTVRYHLQRLEGVNLVTTKRSGRTVQVFPGEVAENLQNGSLNVISDSYVRFLLAKLREGCLHPEVVTKSKKQLVLRIECPDGEDMILNLKMSDWDIFDLEEETGAPLSS